jgi:hypothetical protein
MHKNISKMQAQHGLKSYNFVPKTFILPIETVLLNEVANLSIFTH